MDVSIGQVQGRKQREDSTRLMVESLKKGLSPKCGNSGVAVVNTLDLKKQVKKALTRTLSEQGWRVPHKSYALR